jgi:methylated-DNA-[protein]-cysteine S-methyltransferase
MKGRRHLRQQQQSKCCCVIDSPVGKLGLLFTDNCIAKISFLPPKTFLIVPKNNIERRVVAKIKRYFCDPHCQFDLPMFICGTLLQIKIWQALQKIPVGKVITYGELAKKLNTGPRVIGNACRLNPLPIIIPCHRVIAANGLGGYSGRSNKAIRVKKYLLAAEGVSL